MDVQDMLKVQFDHTKEGLHESFCVDESTDEQCLALVTKLRKQETDLAVMADKVWNCDTLPLNARIYTLFKMGLVIGTEKAVHDCASMTGKLLAALIK